jgi:hypothetical protein
VREQGWALPGAAKHAHDRPGRFTSRSAGAFCRIRSCRSLSVLVDRAADDQSSGFGDLVSLVFVGTPIPDLAHFTTIVRVRGSRRSG